MPNSPVVCIFGADIKLQSQGPVPHFETRDLDCRCYPSDKDLRTILARDRPVAIASFGDISSFENLSASRPSISRIWRHFDSADDVRRIGEEVFSLLIESALGSRPRPLVTVFTPAFKSGDKILKPMSSLFAQTYSEWEWVVVDDSDDNGNTFENLSRMAFWDDRIRVYRESRHSGSIGHVKRTACDLARGEYLVELDHDDELTPTALELVVEAYERHPEVGFIYSDFAECFEGGGKFTYPDGWGMGYGGYREEEHGGVKYMVCCSPKVNAKTIRHVSTSPNHLRSWRKSVYDLVGGHNPSFHVADDYELMVRTFLSTRMGHIPKFCYVQYRNETGNTTNFRNGDIHRLVRYVSQYYDAKIHERLLELGVDDFIWKEGQLSFMRMQSVPNQETESHCTVTL